MYIEYLGKGVIHINKSLIIVVIVAIVGVGAYLLLTGGMVNLTGNGVSISKSITMGTYTGSIKGAVEKGIPLKCTTPKDEKTGIEVVAGYIKGQKYYAEVMQKGKSGYIIMVGNCMYNWEKDNKRGVKMCFSSNIWEQQSSSNANYTCKTAVFSDSLFTPPSDVQFIDADNAGGANGE